MLQLQAGAVRPQQQALLATAGVAQPDQRTQLDALRVIVGPQLQGLPGRQGGTDLGGTCLLYTSDAADE